MYQQASVYLSNKIFGDYYLITAYVQYISMNKRKLQLGGEASSAKILLKPVGKILSQYNNAKSAKRSSFQPGRKLDHYEDQITPSLFQQCTEGFKKFKGSSYKRLQSEHQQQKQYRFNLIEDPRQSEFSYRKYLLIQKILFILTTFSFCIAIISTQLHIFQANMINSDPNYVAFSQNHANMISSLITFLLVLSTLIRYVCLNQLQIDQKKFYYIRTRKGFLAELYRFFKQKRSVQLFVIELLFIFPHPVYLFTDNYVQIFQSYDQILLKHKLNDILSMLSLLRAYIIVRSLINLTIYSTPRASRLCSQNRVNHSILYSVKCLLRQKPLRIITMVFLVNIIALGFGLKLSEGSLIYSNPQLNKTGFEDYLNCYWCVFITMATVGYGDYFPKTLPGRLMAIMAAISGIILSSSLIVSMSAYLTMQANQSKSHLTLVRLQHQQRLKDQATQALIETMRMTKYLSSQQKQNDYKIKDFFTTIKHKIDLVKYRTRKIKSLVNNNNIMQQMNRLFELFKDNLQQSFRNQLMLKQSLDNLKQTPNIQRKMKSIFLTHNMQQIMTNKI